MIKTRLQPHQAAALERALKNNLLLAHSTGSGKTLTSIAIADALGKPTTVLTPASLVENFKKELAKHKKGGPPVNVMSLPTAVSRDYKVPIGNTLIVDEAHSLRNAGTARQAYVKSQLERAGRVFALTGTPAYNEVANWAPLVNIVAKQPVVPEDPGAFEDRYVQVVKQDPSLWAKWMHGVKPGITRKLKNAKELHDKLAPYIDIVDADVEKPERIDQTIEVPMNQEQLDRYKYVLRAMPGSLAWKLTHNMPPSKTEAKALNTFCVGVRQGSNTPEEYKEGVGPGEKIKVAAKNLIDRLKANKDERALIYSNFLASGIDSYSRLLDKAGIKYNRFDGSMTPKAKKQVVDQYNSGEVPVILGSGSASEGLDLQGTRLIQILEPHFNNAKTDQVIGRGIRYKSHEHLPVQDRNVLVQKYLSTFPVEMGIFGKKKPATAIDQYLTSRAAEKDELIRQVKAALTSK